MPLDQCDLTNCENIDCRICYREEFSRDYDIDDQPLTNHSFDNEGFLVR